MLTQDAIEEFVDIVRKVKAARSIMDGLAIGREAYGTIYVGAATVSQYKGVPIDEEGCKLQRTIELDNSSGAFTYVRGKNPDIMSS